MSHVSLCVVMVDLGNLRDQIFPRTGFAPSGAISGPRAPHRCPTPHTASSVLACSQVEGRMDARRE